MSKALTVATTLSSDDLTALLQQSGWAEKPSGEALPRIKLDGNMLTTPDGEMFVYNPKKPEVPAMTIRIVRPPEEYFAIWIDSEASRAIGQPELENTFSKKFLDSDPTRRTWPSDEAFERLKDAGFKSSWKGDMLVQIVPDSGTLTGEEQTYILTLSTTSLIEFKGTSKSPEAGSVSDTNFVRRLSLFALEEATDNPKKAVLDALTSLTLGGVVAEARLIRAENKDLGRTWTVIQFAPIHIEPMQQGDRVLSAGDDPDEIGV